MILKDYPKNELFRAGFLLLILSTLGNIINFIFQFLMARILDDSSFGILSFLTNMTFIIGVPSLAIQTIISKKTIMLRHKKQENKIAGLLNQATSKMLIIFPIVLFIFLFLAKVLEGYTKIPFNAVLLISPFILFALILPIVLGILQGLKKFELLGWNGVINFTFKLVIGTALVVLGFKAYGAIIGIVLGMFIAWIFGYKSIYNKKAESLKENIFSLQDLFPFFAVLAVTLLYSFDVILAKFIFDPIIAGVYAKFSLFGKIIFFSGLTIANVMFPITSEKQLAKKDTSSIIYKSFLIVSAICILGILSILIFPGLIINILFGSKYLQYSSLFLPICVSFSFISLINLYLLYRVAVDKISMKRLMLLVGAILIQIVSLIIAVDITSFARNFMISSILNFILLLLFDIKWKN